MSKLLAIESTSSICSIAVGNDNHILLREQEGQRSHTQFMLPFIDELLLAQSLQVAQLDAIAFAAGPGSFTGIRLAASVAKSLAYAANISVIAISSLAAVAQAFQRIRNNEIGDSCLVITDARMGEVYVAEYQFDANGIAQLVGDERLMNLDRLEELDTRCKIVIGDAFSFIESISWMETMEKIPLQANALDVLMLAKQQLALGKVQAALSAQAIYLRDKSSWKTTEQQIKEQQVKLGK